jgi:hypothetical protein
MRPDSNEKSRRVFISSTYSDLHGLRDIAREVVQLMGFEAECVGALPGLPDAEILSVLGKAVRSCDVLLLIVGFSRGSAPNIEGYKQSSFTQEELKSAKDAQIPVLVFQSAGTKEQAAEWVREFRKSQSVSYVLAQYQDEDDFRIHVAQSLALLRQTRWGAATRSLLR